MGKKINPPKSNKSSPPKISIVIPSFNKAEYLGYTLESIVSQNYPNLEIIIQDGGSQDGTIEIIKDYAERYHNFIHWTSQKDNGQLDAIKKGLQSAKGDILAYINADDVYQKGALYKVAEAYCSNTECLWIVGMGMHIDGRGEEISTFVSKYKNCLLNKNNYFFLLCLNYLMQPSVFITKKAYLMYGPFSGNSSFVLEYDLWLKIGKVQMPIIIDDVLAAFRITGDSITSSQSHQLLSENYRIVKAHTKNPLILLSQNFNNTGKLLTILLIRHRLWEKPIFHSVRVLLNKLTGPDDHF